MTTDIIPQLYFKYREFTEVMQKTHSLLIYEISQTKNIQKYSKRLIDNIAFLCSQVKISGQLDWKAIKNNYLFHATKWKVFIFCC